MGHNLSADALRQFVARIERLEAEKTALTEDIKEVYAEVKSHGYDARTIREIIRERKRDQAERAEQLDLFNTYWAALDGAPE